MGDLESKKILYPTGNSFINIRTEIRNKQLSDDTAWQKAQPLFLNRINTLDDAEKAKNTFQKYTGFLKDLFHLRRQAFLGRNVEENSKEATKRISELEIDDKKELSPLIILIRDVFDITPPQKGRRRL